MAVQAAGWEEDDGRRGAVWMILFYSGDEQRSSPGSMVDAWRRERELPAMIIYYGIRKDPRGNGAFGWWRRYVQFRKWVRQ